MKMLRFAAATVLALGAWTQVHAASIDTLTGWDPTLVVDAFGGANTGVYGESFIAPGGNLVSYTFEVNTSIALNVVAQVYAWSGQLYGDSAAGAVGPALFSSAPIVISSAGGFQAVTINTGSIALTQGGQYVALLADTGGDLGAASFGLATGAGAHPDVLGDGGFNFYNNDYTISSIANIWDASKDYGSLAWQANFAVPEPASMAVLSAGLFGIGVIRRRKAA
jgi:hypothetical protein